MEEILIFSYVLGLSVEKWRDGKLFCLVEKKNERIENIVCKIYHHVPIR